MIKKYGLRILFVLALGLCGAAASVQLGVIVMRWQDNMTKTQRVGAGERAFAMPAGSLPRSASPAPRAGHPPTSVAASTDAASPGTIAVTSPRVSTRPSASPAPTA